MMVALPAVLVPWNCPSELWNRALLLKLIVALPAVLEPWKKMVFPIAKTGLFDEWLTIPPPVRNKL
jgi:hypothetical protein